MPYVWTIVSPHNNFNYLEFLTVCLESLVQGNPTTGVKRLGLTSTMSFG